MNRSIKRLLAFGALAFAVAAPAATIVTAQADIIYVGKNGVVCWTEPAPGPDIVRNVAFNC